MSLQNNFPKAVDTDLGNGAYRPGLQALKAEDRDRVSLRDSRQCHGSEEDLLELFGLPNSPGMRDVFGSVLNDKTLRSFYFHPETTGGVITRDISSLDPLDDDDLVADWGGLTLFSSRASDVISRVMQGGDE